MPTLNFDPDDVATPVGGYHQAVLAGGLLFISGQTPEGPDGTVPPDPEGQFRQIWANIAAIIRDADMDMSHLVHVRTYLARGDVQDLNADVRREVLGGHRPALTVITCDLFDPRWIAEIEAIAYRDQGPTVTPS